MPRRWSRLQKQIYNLLDKKISMQIHCIGMNNDPDGNSFRGLGLYKVSVGKEIIWNFPKDFITYDYKYPDGGDCFSYSVTDINLLVRKYIDTPKDALLWKQYENDWFKLTDLLKAADRRFGREKLLLFFKDCENEAVGKILKLRFEC